MILRSLDCNPFRKKIYSIEKSAAKQDSVFIQMGNLKDLLEFSNLASRYNSNIFEWFVQKKQKYKYNGLTSRSMIMQGVLTCK